MVIIIQIKNGYTEQSQTMLKREREMEMGSVGQEVRWRIWPACIGLITSTTGQPTADSALQSRGCVSIHCAILARACRLPIRPVSEPVWDIPPPTLSGCLYSIHDELDHPSLHQQLSYSCLVNPDLQLNIDSYIYIVLRTSRMMDISLIVKTGCLYSTHFYFYFNH